MRRFALFLATLLVTAQAPIRVGTRLVEVQVVVRDKKGPVHGLAQSEFEILDQGKPQKIAIFGERTVPAATDPKPKPLGPDVASNIITRSGERASNVTVVLLDRINTAVQDQAYANKQVLKVLKALQPGDRVALYTMGKSIRIIEDFTGDPERLHTALERLGPEQSVDLAASDGDDSDGILPDSEIPSTGDPQTDQAVQNSIAAMREFAMQNRVNATALAMNQLAKHLAGIPGRKNLIWVSAGFPFVFQFREYQNSSDRFLPAIRAMTDANVAVYPVDARGLKPTGLQAASVSPPGRPGMPPRVIPDMTGPNSGLDTMNILASATGGRVFHNSNDVSGAVRAALDDAQAVYTLGFYPEESALDQKFHTLHVRVDRKGLELHHRQQYFAGDLPVLDLAKRRAALMEALATPLEATEIGIAAVAEPVKDQTGKFLLGISLNLGDFHLEAQGDQITAGLDIATLIASARPLKLRIESRTFRLTNEQAQATIQRGFGLQLPLETDGKKTVLRLVIQDRTTGALGSVTVPVQAH
jgi:VWFA-related protein